jgi:PAS domain S-box-containing protein
MAKSELAGDHDVEMLKSIQGKLEQSKQMLRMVLDTVPVRVFWKDIHLRFLGCNMPFALDAGLRDPSELLGKTDFDMGWRNQAAQYRADDMSVIESGKPKLNYEEPQTTPRGKTIWLKTSKIPLQNEQGEIIGILGTYEDITESKRSALIQEAIYGIAGATVSSGSMESLIADIRAQLSVLVETPNFYIALYDESRRHAVHPIRGR